MSAYLFALVGALVGCAGAADSTGTTLSGPIPAHVSLSPTMDTLLVGHSSTLTAQVSDSAGAAIANQTITWASSNANVASVSAGVVTALAAGTDTITATAGTVSASAVITVFAPPTISGFAPTHAAYGFNVVITGSGFTPSTSVTINGVAASVLASSATSLTVAVPAAATTGPVVITSEGGSTSSTAFTVDAYGPPIVISAGGSYSGNWESLDPNVPAVRVATGDPVVIENCHVASRGDAIQAYGVTANLTVRHCTGEGLNPNVVKMQMGFFVVASQFGSVIVENNLIEHFRQGLDAVNYPPGVAENFSGQIVKFRYNIVHDMEGRFSDGNGGFQAGNFLEGTSGQTVACCTYFVRNGSVEMAWNEVVNQPYVSQAEDLVSTAESRGQPGNPIDIHDNYIEGSRPADAATYQTFGGCGIQIGDSPSKTDVGYVHVHDNQVVGFAGCGISISSGHNVEVDHNRVISARTLPDGTVMNNNWRSPLLIRDYYWWVSSSYGDNFDDPFWHDDSVHDNAFSAVARDGTLALPDYTNLRPTVVPFNNTDALGHLATTADEQAEYQLWKQKLKANGITIGP